MGTNVIILNSRTHLDQVERSNLSSKNSFDKVRVLYEYFFSTEQDLKDQNKYLLQFLFIHLQNDGQEVVKRFISDSAFNDLHPSLIKSAHIITNQIDQ